MIEPGETAWCWKCLQVSHDLQVSGLKRLYLISVSMLLIFSWLGDKHVQAVFRSLRLSFAALISNSVDLYVHRSGVSLINSYVCPCLYSIPSRSEIKSVDENT